MYNQSVLITGAAGFIGSHLVEACVRKGLKVRATVHYNSMNTWGWLEKLAVRDEIEILSGDIRDYDFVFKAIKECDTVFHLAALIGIPYSYISPLAYIRTNIEGTYNVLQAAKEQGVGNVLVTSTSETYGTAQYVPIDEKHPLVGQSPYSASKIAADQLAISFHRSFRLPVKIVRPFNTYGPRQSARAIIPTIITQILSGQKEIKLGNIAPTRDFTYVKDTVEGFLFIAGNDRLNGEVVNLGTGSEISVGNLVELIATLIGEEVKVVEDGQRVRSASSEVDRLCCDASKIKKFTGWTSRYDLNTGLKETIEWIESNLSFYKAELYNV